MKGLAIFFSLQALDMITTLRFRSIGVEESNPILNALAPHTGMEFALFLLKFVAVAIGLVWYFKGRSLTKVNIAFVCLIAWNLIAIHAWQKGVRYCGEKCWGQYEHLALFQQFEPIKPTPIRPTPIGKGDWKVKRTPAAKTTAPPPETPISTKPTTEDKPEPETQSVTPYVIEAHPVKPEPLKPTDKPRINNQ